MKVVINKCFGGFGLSPEALQRLYDLGCAEIAKPVDEHFGDRMDGPLGFNEAISEWRAYTADRTQRRSLFLTTFTPDEKFVLYPPYDLKRDDPRLVQVVEEMGEAANDRCASLSVVEIPDGVQYEIQEYDGHEHIAEVHRTWS